MSNRSRQQLLALCDELEKQIGLLRQMIIDEIPESSWITTAEYANHPNTNLTAKTAANYCKQGRLKSRQTPTGRWQIHKSELY